MEKYNFHFEEDTCRLDSFLSRNIDLTRSAIQKLIEDGMVEVNSKKADKSYKLKKFDSIDVSIPDPKPLLVEGENIPLDIMYEDDYLLVVNKPKGMVVHPAPGNYSGTLVNALMYHCKDSLSGINGVMRPGIVHRIDKDTSGLLIVAKNDLAHSHLALQIKEHSFTREYEGVAVGNIKTDSGDIELPIGRHPVNRKQMTVTYKNSKPAKTHYQVLERSEGLSHLRLTLFTGRTHQIRVHMAYLGYPLAGDLVYGRAGARYKQLGGQCLHAKKIGFIHPKTNEYMEFESELPKYFKDFLKENGFSGTF